MALAVLFLTAVLSSQATAASFHGYSHAWESSGNYAGISNTRIDRAVGGLPSDGCSQPYSGTPVYETMWLQYSPGNNYELGTGHQCGDQYRYWFWGLSVNSTFYSLGYQTGITNDNSHTFRMDRVLSGFSGYQIYYRIDGATKKTYPTSAANFVDLDVGLESYCQTCTVSAYSNSSLKFKVNDTWSNWAGRDGQQVNDPPMCGSWLSDTSWRSGEVASC